MPQIFLSYRRSESKYIAPMLSEKLEQRFGDDSVFLDVDNIPLGVDFREFIGNAVGQCDVLIALIGEEWVRAVDDRGNRRLDDPSDFVRIEIESALKRSIPVIPVLVDGVKMPAKDELPPSIQSLVYRNATELRAGRDLHQHIEGLIDGLASLFSPKNLPPEKAISVKDPVPDSKQAKVSDRTDAPSDLLEEIQNTLAGFTDGSLFVGTIPTKKLKNAISTYATDVASEDVLLLFDNTVFGSAKDGLILTADAVYWHDGEPDRLRYAEIRKVDTLKYSLSASIVLNDKEIEIRISAENDKVAEAIANVIRLLRELSS
ncbi:MAG TPA: toll/interleukin-1 receptor domain-containing protein [Pyrinomonadaceae bacterium]|nr:toll/interleukin-1 receptor domain-containing protein [Pyrinomonadaceae bacterium]